MTIINNLKIWKKLGFYLKIINNKKFQRINQIKLIISSFQNNVKLFTGSFHKKFTQKNYRIIVKYLSL